MPDMEHQSEVVPPSPLNHDEVVALGGVGAVVVGTLLPALSSGIGGSWSFLDTGRTTTVLLWGLAGCVVWSVVRRRAHDVSTPGLLMLLCLISFGLFVWLEDVRHPIATFFGSQKSGFRPLAWIVVALGAGVIQYAGRCARKQSQFAARSTDSSDRLRGVGVILATLGCLYGIALVHPFGYAAPPEIERLSHSYEDELQVLRWLLLGSAAFGVVASFQSPERSEQYLGRIIRTAGLIIGSGIFTLVSLAVPETRLLSVPVCIAWVAFTIHIWVTAKSSHAVARSKRLVVLSPFIGVFGLLLLSGEVGDLMLFLYSPFVIAAGYVICRNTTYVDAAIFAAILLIGFPAGFMALGGVPNEISRLLGLNAAEARLAALGISTLLVWTLYLSFLNDIVDQTENENDNGR